MTLVLESALWDINLICSPKYVMVSENYLEHTNCIIFVVATKNKSIQAT
jgi:hypothetical protein